MTLEIDGKTISNPKQLSSLWAKYYESLFTPSRAFNEAFKDHTDSEVERLVGCDVPYDFILDDPVTVEEIRCVLTKLPSGKAPGHDGIFYEHIKLAGDIMVTYLVQLFNSIIKREYIPWSFKLGVKIPIPKGRKTGVYTFDDYRGISASFNKIMERLVLLRIQEKPKCTLHNLQGAYRSEQDALTTAFITDETIKHCCEEKDKVYVCYIDITKAFDKLWINGMLYKLFQSVGISGKCLRIIKLWYTGMREMVCIDGNYSKCYNILQGTRQGGVLSPWLFTVFVNDLISILQRTGLGIVIHDMYYGSPMFADDLTMLSRLKFGLDQMLKSLHDYSLLWRITFNQKKTVVMVFGERKADKHNLGNSRVWSLGNMKLSEKLVWKNLGKIWHVDRKSVEPVEDAVKKGYMAGAELAGAGCRCQGVNPVIACRMWKRVVLPKMLYGCELWQFNKQNILQLEKCQNVFVRIIEGLLPGTSASAARGLLGLWSVEGEIEKRKLYFLERLVNSSTYLAHRKLLLIRFLRWKYRQKEATGFVPDVMNAAWKHDLWTYIEEFLNHGTFPPKRQWNRAVFAAIQATEERCWQERLALKGMERYLRIHSKLKPLCWFTLLRRYPTLNGPITTVVRLLCNSFMVNGERMNTCLAPGLCHGCNRTYLDPVAHIILNCRRSQDQRARFWDRLLDSMPLEFYSYFLQMDDEDMLDVLFGKITALSNEFVDDFMLRSAYYIDGCVRDTVLIIVS